MAFSCDRIWSSYALVVAGRIAHVESAVAFIMRMHRMQLSLCDNIQLFEYCRMIAMTQNYISANTHTIHMYIDILCDTLLFLT